MSTQTPSRLLLLPGASGDTGFWCPVAALLAHPAQQVHVGWPGFGPTPADPAVTRLADLVQRVVSLIDRPTALIAQSMGGAIPLLAGLQRPELVTHLVLAALSGGIDAVRLGGRDWRPPPSGINFGREFLFAAYRDDLTPSLASIGFPALLLWGGADPISPVRVGERVASLLPHCELHVVAGGGHAFANTHAAQVAALSDRHFHAPRDQAR